jgi:hypothetical protein
MTYMCGYVWMMTYNGSMWSLDDFEGGSYADWESKPPMKSTRTNANKCC